VEDPSRPDFIMHRLIRSDEFANSNSERGFNERQICWAIVAFTFARWDEEVRPKLAKVRGVEPNEIQVDAFGDLRLLRKGIIHNRGIIVKSDHEKMKLMGHLCAPNEVFSPTHDEMHKIFVCLKSAIATQVLLHTGLPPGVSSASDIVGIAIQGF
jgi:hypothetical protein